MDIPEEREEINVVVDRLAFETVLEEMTEMLVLLVVVLCIGGTYPLNDVGQTFRGFSYQ